MIMWTPNTLLGLPIGGTPPKTSAKLAQSKAAERHIMGAYTKLL